VAKSPKPTKSASKTKAEPTDTTPQPTPLTEVDLWMLSRLIEAAKPHSSTYQAILAEGRAKAIQEGRVEGGRSFVLRLGSKRFGPPDAAMRARLDAITSTEQLERLAGRLLEVETWSELLASD